MTGFVGPLHASSRLIVTQGSGPEEIELRPARAGTSAQKFYTIVKTACVAP
jgi:hypothetical protein